jgi:hypothetical protein
MELKMELANPVSTRSDSPLAILASMFYEPGAAFAALERRRFPIFITALLIASSCILVIWYFNVVDFAWLIEQTFAVIENVAQREQAQKLVTKTMVLAGALGGSVVGTPAVLAALALYFSLVGKVMNKNLTFETGFALSAWAFAPSLLLLPLGIIQIMLSANGQLGLDQLNPLSLNQLVFHFPLGHPLASPLGFASVTSVWTLVLLIIGFASWMKVSRASAIKVVLLPVVAIYGGWLAFALSKVA